MGMQDGSDGEPRPLYLGGDQTSISLRCGTLLPAQCTRRAVFVLCLPAAKILFVPAKKERTGTLKSDLDIARIVVKDLLSSSRSSIEEMFPPGWKLAESQSLFTLWAGSR